MLPVLKRTQLFPMRDLPLALPFVTAEHYGVEEQSYFPEIAETPKEPFKPILKYVDKLLRLVLMLYCSR